MDKEEEIGTKMINKHDENDLGIKHASFKWTSATGVINAIRINCYDKVDLRFEVLKGLKIDDAVECNDDMSSVKEILMKVQKNNRKLFVGIESGMGKTQRMC